MQLNRAVGEALSGKLSGKLSVPSCFSQRILRPGVRVWRAVQASDVVPMVHCPVLWLGVCPDVWSAAVVPRQVAGRPALSTTDMKRNIYTQKKPKRTKSLTEVEIVNKN